MQQRPLGTADLTVSAICLGTMTWGEQNTAAEGHAQLDYALERGVNFFDTAELYPVPPKEETYGRTEEIIGEWFAARRNRDKVVLASKIVGASGFEYMRPKGTAIRMDKKNMAIALEASLKRLQTDYIDLYQLHWPDRPTNNFGQLGYSHESGASPLHHPRGHITTPVSDGDNDITLAETLDALQDFVSEGKIRHVGLSNETPWGVLECLRQHEQHGKPRMQSIQNPYSLLNRSYEVGLAEISIREQVGLLAYSPLAFGVLSGKYLDGKKPAGARLTLFERFQRYLNPRALDATKEYVALAQQYGLDPAQVALQYVTQQPFVTSNIIGATSLEQLKSNIDSVDITLPEQLLKDINAVHQRNSNPAP